MKITNVTPFLVGPRPSVDGWSPEGVPAAGTGRNLGGAATSVAGVGWPGRGASFRDPLTPHAQYREALTCESTTDEH